MKNKAIVLILFCLALFGTCQKDPNPNGERFQILKEKEQVSVGSNSVSITGEFAYSGKVDGMTLRIGTDEHLNSYRDHTLSLSGSTYSVFVDSLASGAKYYYRYLADYGSLRPWLSDIYSFTTLSEVDLPTVVTMEVSGVMVSAATCHCNVIDDGGAPVTERGICWSAMPNPDIDDMVYANGEGMGEYSVSMSSLMPSTTYYVCAYAKNSKGVGYGETLSFTTLTPVEPPFGALGGLFTVAEGRQVWFSQGNLQYHATSNQWRFAEEQYACIGMDNANIAEDYNGWIDLFGWATSGYSHGAVCYQPWSISEETDHYWAYGDIGSQLYDQSGMADWGYNCINNGGEAENLWRTLTIDEWLYLFNERTTPSGIRFAKAQVDGVNGFVLLPDSWSDAAYHLNNVNQAEAGFSDNVITELSWYVSLENNCAIFLPAAGYRSAKTLEYVGNGGYYHSSECKGKYARAMALKSDVGELTVSRYRGLSVRLVCDAAR